MKKFLIGAAAMVTALIGAVGDATPAAAREFAHGGGYAGYRGGGEGYRGGGEGYRGGYGGGYGYRGGYGYGGPALVAGLAGLAVGASLAGGYYGPPPAYYVGPSYYGWYGGCRREWVWSPRWGGYRIVQACF